MTNDLLTQLHETTENLLETIALFTQEQFNTIPVEGSWTAAQVCEHVFKSEAGIPGILQGNTILTTRQPDEKAAEIRRIFLDLSHKLQSPEFILPSPSDKKQNKEERIQSLRTNRENIEKIAANMDLTLTCTDFALPAMGQLTAFEWITFITCHSARHIQQLKNIYPPGK